eukprot:6491734-Amphidinium_carterae.2
MADPKNETPENQGRDVRVLFKPSRERQKCLKTAEKFGETRTAARCTAVLARVTSLTPKHSPQISRTLYFRIIDALQPSAFKTVTFVLSEVGTPEVVALL